MPSFEQLIIWQRARGLAIGIYRLARETGLARDFALRDQIQRSVVSIASNIAEGAERDQRKEFAYFLRVAKASGGELRAQLILAADIGLCPVDRSRELQAIAEELCRMIGGLIKRLQT